MRVLAFGTYDARRHPRAGVLIEGLRAHGHDVREVNHPLELSTAERVAMLRRPWRLPRLARLLAQAWFRLVRTARRIPGPDVVLVGFLGQFDVLLARRLFPRTPIVLDLLISAETTARDRGTTNPVVLGALGWLDRRAVASADLVLVDTDENQSATGPRRSADTIVVPVGASRAWFAARRELASADVLRVIFFGLFTPLQGAPVIGAAARLLEKDRIEFTLIGSGQDHDATVRAVGADHPNVTWVPWVPAEDLPGVVAEHDVCLGIFGAGSKARRVVPNKVYQGMAAGLAVVTSDTPPQRRALGDAAAYVPADDPAALAVVLRSLAADRSALAGLQERAAACASETMTAAAVTTRLSQRLDDLVAQGRVG